jgi:uncharacterized protein (TIGR03083 family)
MVLSRSDERSGRQQRRFQMMTHRALTQASEIGAVAGPIDSPFDRDHDRHYAPPWSCQPTSGVQQRREVRWTVLRTLHDELAQLAVEGEALIAAATDLAAPVPTCPGWSIGDLLEHVGRVHGWVVSCLRADPTTSVLLRDEPDGPTGAQRVDWYRSMHRTLLEELERAARCPKVAGPSGPTSPRFWSRRQAHETSVHRWDAEHALSTPRPIEADWAIDAIDEFCEVFLPLSRPDARSLPRSLVLRVPLSGPSWVLRFADRAVTGCRGDRDGELVVEGKGPDLLLWLWGRPCAVSALAGVSSEEVNEVQRQLRH